MRRAASSLSFLLGAASALAFGWLLLPLALYTGEPQPVAFSHAAHGAEGAGMACEDCHGIGEDGRFTGVPGVAACAECHQEPIGNSAEEKRLVDEFVSAGVEIPWKIYSRQPDHVFFPHATHVELAGLACETCHGDLGKGTAPPPYEENRLTGYARFSRELSLVRIARGVADGRKMTVCSECHADSGVEESCLDCHK